MGMLAIKPENVPETVWRSAMTTYHKTLRKNPGMAWQEAVIAAINAWPGMKLNPSWELRTHKRSVEIILPLSELPKLDRKAAVAERLFGDD